MTAELRNHHTSHPGITAGDEFTIADIARLGWLWRRQFPGLSLDDRPDLSRRYEAITARPAVQRVIARGEAPVEIPASAA